MIKVINSFFLNFYFLDLSLVSVLRNYQLILSKRFPFFPPFRNFSKEDPFQMLIDFLRKLGVFNIRYFIETTSRKRDYEFQMKVSTPSKCKNRGQSTAMSTHLQLKFITLIRTLSSSIGENSFSSFS